MNILPHNSCKNPSVCFPLKWWKNSCWVNLFFLSQQSHILIILSNSWRLPANPNLIIPYFFCLLVSTCSIHSPMAWQALWHTTLTAPWLASSGWTPGSSNQPCMKKNAGADFQQYCRFLNYVLLYFTILLLHVTCICFILYSGERMLYKVHITKCNVIAREL